jgi:mannosyltransferase
MISRGHSVDLAPTNSTDAHESAEVPNTILLVWGIVLMGAVLRLIALGHKSFWLDEIASVVIVRMPGNSFWSWVWHSEGNMALYYVMLRPWLHFGLAEASVRVLSVLPGIASLPMMYLLGARLFGREVGMLATLFLALSTCSVVYSQEARGYSWLLLGVIASTYLFVRLIERPTYGMAFAYALAAGVTLYFHYFGLLVLLAHAVSLLAFLRDRRPWKHLFAASAILAALALPVLWMIHIQPSQHLDWVTKPSLLEVYHLGVFLAAESGKGVGPVLLALELVLVGAFLRTLISLRGSISARSEYWNYALVASALFTPVIITLLVSAVRPVLFHRFLIICLPAWLLAVAVGANGIARPRTRSLAIAAVCALSLVSTVTSYTRVREDWRGVANYLIANAAAQDRVVYYEGVGNFAAESYRDWLPGGTNNRPAAIEVSPASNEWRDKLPGAGRVWLVRYPTNKRDDTARSVDTELQSRYTAGQTKQFRSITVTEFVQKQ